MSAVFALLFTILFIAFFITGYMGLRALLHNTQLNTYTTSDYTSDVRHNADGRPSWSLLQEHDEVDQLMGE